MINGILIDKKDKFGPLEYVIHDIIFQLPRKAISETHFITAEQLMLNFSGLDEQQDTECYSAIPLSMYGTMSKMEAQTVVKQYIWNNFFNLSKTRQHTWDCAYCEGHHYPIAFRYNLKDKLHIKNIDSLEDLQEFTTYVMNAVFDRVVYIYDSMLLAAANDLCKGIVKMDSVAAYRVRKEYKQWLER